MASLNDKINDYLITLEQQYKMQWSSIKHDLQTKAPDHDTIGKKYGFLAAIQGVNFLIDLFDNEWSVMPKDKFVFFEKNLTPKQLSKKMTDEKFYPDDEKYIPHFINLISKGLKDQIENKHFIQNAMDKIKIDYPHITEKNMNLGINKFLDFNDTLKKLITPKEDKHFPPEILNFELGMN